MSALVKLPFFYIDSEKYQKVISLNTATDIIVESFLFIRKQAGKENYMLGTSENLMMHTYEYIKRDAIDIKKYYVERKKFVKEVINYMEGYRFFASINPVVFVAAEITDELVR